MPKKIEAWQTAIGLQAVDELKYIRVFAEHRQRPHRGVKSPLMRCSGAFTAIMSSAPPARRLRTKAKEADIVSARVAKLLGEKAFRSRLPSGFPFIAGCLRGVFSHVNPDERHDNITKKEWVLGGDTLDLCGLEQHPDTLDYDFATEKQFSYEGLVRGCSGEASGEIRLEYLADPSRFGEGNTRATAVFVIKYMKAFGFRVNNDAFEEELLVFPQCLGQSKLYKSAKGRPLHHKVPGVVLRESSLGTDHELKKPFYAH